MKIYDIGILEWSWDEYDSFIVIANSKEEVRKLVLEKVYSNKEDWEKVEIDEIGIYTGKRKDSHIVCDSFNAG